MQRKEPKAGKKKPSRQFHRKGPSVWRRKRDADTQPDNVIALSTRRLSPVWRRTLDLVVEHFPPALWRRPRRKPPWQSLQVPTAELFSKVLSKFGRVGNMDWIADYLREHHRLDEEYVAAIYQTYFFVNAAHVDYFWGDGIYDYVSGKHS
jgi:hypothetical protein